MFENDYKKELESISASENFKNNTLSLMYAKQEEPAKTIKFSKRRYAALAASVAVVFMVLAVHFMGKSDYFITADNAVTEQHSQTDQQKDVGTDALPYGTQQMPMMRVFGIGDAQEIKPVGSEDRLKTKVYFDGRSNGGMGFEGYMLYHSYQLEQNKTYSINDEFDTLPVYRCISLTEDEIDRFIKEKINLLGLGYDRLKYVWSKPVYDENGNLFTEKNITTETAICPEEGYSLFSVNGNLSDDNGKTAELWRWPASGSVGIIIDDLFTQSENIYDVADAAFEKYSTVLDKSTMDVHTWLHYNIYGEQTYDIYAYEKTDDYGENLFNSNLNNIYFSQYSYYEADTELTNCYFNFSLPAYSKVDDLPAIDYRQALAMFYDGNFYTTYSDEINEDTVVSHIELVYRSPEYDMATKTKKGYALPFYKFYVQLDESYDSETADGTLHTYAAYYVCAIHPEYVALDESYFHFN